MRGEVKEEGEGERGRGGEGGEEERGRGGEGRRKVWSQEIGANGIGSVSPWLLLLQLLLFCGAHSLLDSFVSVDTS